MRIELREADARGLPLGTLFGAVLALGAVLAFVWLRLELPLPVCRFRSWTGLPCPTCGTTRLVESLFSGDIAQAFAWNPLIFVALAGLAAWAVGSTVVRLLHLPSPRLRLEPREWRWSRIAALAALAAGWLYLLVRQA